MRRVFLALTIAATALTGTAVSTSAAPLSAPSTLRDAFTGMDSVQDVAICFYIDGWNGPGLYECGFRWRRGYGWHGRRDDHRGRDRGHDHRHDHDHRGDRR